MIKKFNKFNEGLLDKLKGPNDEEIWKILNKLDPKDMMFKSAEIGFYPGIEKAIELGADIKDREDFENAYGEYDDQNILDVVAYKGYEELFDKIYKNFVSDSKKRDTKYLNHLLINVCKTNNISFAKKLIEMGAKIYAYNNRALITASEYGQLSMIKFLLENGAYIFADHNDALKRGIEGNYTDIVKFLLEKGADLDDVDLDSYDFGEVFKKDNTELFELLIKNGLDVNEIFNEHTIMDLLGDRSYGIIKLLIGAGFKLKNKIASNRIKTYGPLTYGKPLDNSIIEFLKTNNIIEND